MLISLFGGSKKLNNDLSSSTTKIITTQMKSAKSEVDEKEQEHYNNNININQHISSDEASNSDSNNNDVSIKKQYNMSADDFQEIMKKKHFNQRKMCKRYVLFCVSLALLLDGMLNMVIIPVVPEFLRLLKLQTDASYSNNLAAIFVSNNDLNQTFNNNNQLLKTSINFYEYFIIIY